MNRVLFKQWNGFKTGDWAKTVNVSDFIKLNYQPYHGTSGFLSGPTKATTILWKKISNLMKKEKNNGGVLGIDPRSSSINAYKPGYIDKKLEKIVGIQTEKPLVRAFMPRGGIKMAVQASQQYNQLVDKKLIDIYTNYVTTHNQAVFDCYTKEMLDARHCHILTGLPDTYARGRVIGDYRRIALYGVDYLIKQKINERNNLSGNMTDDVIQDRYELALQIKALEELKKMAKQYGFDISIPAANAKQAIQWTYFGYLAAIKDQNGAAMSIGRNTTFFDIYLQRDIAKGILNEQQAQELIDHYVMKLRIVRFARIKSYNDIFAGDPVWATESLGGMANDGRTLVTKTSFRILHTLSNMGPAPEPNLTVLWSQKLPLNFKKFCAEYSIKYSAIQYESDDLMRPMRGDDYSIACCVSPMAIGKETQQFGARANLAKALLYAINNGRDETHPGYKLGPDLGDLPLTKPLNYEIIVKRYKKVLDWLAHLYVNTLNVIHYNHDKFYYEALEFALHDYPVVRFFATGIAGISVVADSLCAIKYAKVTPIWKNHIAVDFKINGSFPKYGNNNDQVDKIAVNVLKYFSQALKKHKTYRNGRHSLSVLTITSNVMYGAATGATPDGRKTGSPFAPGANPMHGRDNCGVVASLSSVAKLPFIYAMDGISNTCSIIPAALGHLPNERQNNLVNLIDGYFAKKAQHLNVNILERKTLLDAQKHPEKYPQLTIRVSGYAVNFTKLSKQHQDEVIARTFHAQ